MRAVYGSQDRTPASRSTAFRLPLPTDQDLDQDIGQDPGQYSGSDSHEEPPVELVRTFGWRILLGQFRTHDEAVKFQRSSMRRLRRDDVDVKFQAPWYKVLTGHFRRKTEAQQLVERVRAHYRNATTTRGEVFLPRKRIDNR